MNRFQQKKWVLVALLFSLIGFLVFNSCSDSSTNSKDKKNENLSALIYLSGTQILTKYSDWPIPENDVPVVDTTRVSFLMKIHSVEEEEESIRMYGLEGADVGKRENYLFPDCTQPDDCKVIGKLVDEVLEINLENSSRSYEAEGNIFHTYNPYVEMNAIYEHQNITIEYELSGGTSEE